ncbi:MAG: sigma-70 family RNA polymerase sigma factor [Acidobacteriota bacterium]
MLPNPSSKAEAYEAQSRADRDQVILEHLPRVRYIAQRIAARLPRGVQLDDLVSSGILGLLDAYEKFDPEKGVSFRTYASLRIKGAILDSLRGLDWAPRELRSRSREIEQAYARLEQKLSRAATDEEVAAELEIDLKTFHTLLERLNGLSVGHFSSVEGDPSAVDANNNAFWYSPVSPGDSPFESVSKAELRRLLAGIIEQLPRREQLLLSLYYKEELTMKEIGPILGVKESRVSQLHTRAVLRIRARLQSILKRKHDL